MDAVKKYQRRRDERLAARGFRKDDEGETNNNNGGGKKAPVSHGNTRLPFGLCQRFGIEIGAGWTPRDAWDALAGKGVTPGEMYSRLKKKPEKIKIGKSNYDKVFAKKSDSGKYSLRGAGVLGKTDKHPEKDFENEIGTYKDKNEMYAFLKYWGLPSIDDPDTGEKVDLSKVETPKIVGCLGGKPYTRVTIGTLHDRGGAYSGRGYTVTGTQMDGYKHKLKVFKTQDEAQKYAESLVKDPGVIKISPELRRISAAS